MPRDTPAQSDRRRDRPRSRSPYHKERSHKHHHSRRPSSRSRSPHRDNERHHRHTRHRSRSPPPRPVELPYKAKQLSKRHYAEYKPLFQSYLDIQKQIHLDDLGEREIRGRWKSFVSRWNRGDLARSWYDPSMLQTARETVQSYQQHPHSRSHSPLPPPRRPSPDYGSRQPADPQSDDDDDDDFGPAPPAEIAARHTGHGPTIPRFDDLALRDEQRNEDRARNQADYVDDIRHERKLDRNAQKERLEELVPRADPGSRERQLEKKRETTSTLKEFRDAKEGGDVEIGDADLMGDDSIDGYKRRKVEQERQKNERELRREEIARARVAEREERMAGHRAKEAQTMDFLKQLARERFG